MTLITKEPGTTGVRRFDFARDSFAFANELQWEYKSGAVAGKLIFRKREPKPDYSHRCFVLVRAARQFLYHTRFEPDQRIASEETYRCLIRRTLARSPRKLCAPGDQIVIPGFSSLRAFSAARETLLKTECGRAWQSYVLRSHWRMVFPISRRHQARTAEALAHALGQHLSPIVHLVKFPALTINHGMLLIDVLTAKDTLMFSAYDPNQPATPAQLTFDRLAQNFVLPANSYWAGGGLNVIQIFQNWLM